MNHARTSAAPARIAAVANGDKEVEDGDHVDHLIEQWRTERPDVDTSPMVVIARLSRLSRIFERRVEDLYREFGLNQSQFGVLAALRRAGPPYCLSPTDLYNSLLISSGAMTNRLERLSAAGYIKRISDPEDGRSMLVSLTPAGKRLIDRIIAPHYENERRLLASLTAKEQKQLATLLRRLLIELEDHAPPGPVRPLPAAPTTEDSSRRQRAGSDRSRTQRPAKQGT
jgi:DNA-binding MarR family transcriptional regulator